jgi:aspartokinase-like uncharacterized kinase
LETIIKIGGSLAKTPKILKKLCKKIEEISKDHKLCIVPGGSKFADIVRHIDLEYNLTVESAHKMAILGMDQYGFMLNDLISNSKQFRELKKYKRILEQKQTPIFLPAQHMFINDPLENSWNITSDSIAIYVSKKLEINNVIIITDVDGIFDQDPRKVSTSKIIEKLSAKELLDIGQNTCIDKFSAQLLINSQKKCYVVNGRYPKRIDAIFNEKKTIYTLINS